MDSNPLVLIIRTLGELYIFILLLRIILQVSKADYYNPISQGVVRLTGPVLSPLQKILPKIAKTDISPLIVAILVKGIILFALLALSNYDISLINLGLYSLIGVFNTFLDVFFYAVLGSVIISWVAPDSYHPAPQLIMQITKPLYELVQKVIPPIGGFDLSPIVIFIVIQLVQSQLRPFII